MQIKRPFIPVFLALISILLFDCKKDNISDLAEITEAASDVANATTVATNRYMWLYDFSATSINKTLITNCSNMKVNNLFVSMNPNYLYPSGKSKSQAYTASFVDLLNQARLKNIKVHLLILETTSYVFTANHPLAQEKVQSLLAFCNTNPTYILNPIVGIHSDVEPHALTEWQNTTDWRVRELLMQQYIALLKKVYTQVKSSTLPVASKLAQLQVSAAMAWWLFAKAADGSLPSGSPAKFRTGVDFVVPMVYLDPAQASQFSTLQKIAKITSNATTDVTVCPTVIGINADDFDSYANIEDVYSKLYTNFQLKTNFKGICLFRYASMFSFYLKR